MKTPVATGAGNRVTPLRASAEGRHSRLQIAPTVETILPTQKIAALGLLAFPLFWFSGMSAVGDAVALAAAALLVPGITKGPGKTRAVWIAGMVFMSVYVLRLLGSIDPLQGMRHTAAAFVTVTCVAGFGIVGPGLRHSRWFARSAIAIALATCIMSLISGSPKNLVAGAFVFSLALIGNVLIVTGKAGATMASAAISIAGAAVALTVGARGIAVYALAILPLVLVLRRVARIVRIIIGLSLSVGYNVMFVTMVVNWQYWREKPIVSAMLYELGGRLNSGREWLWSHIFETVRPYRWFGMGSDVIPGNFLPTSWSSHNTFVQILLQVGLVGLVAAIAVLGAVWLGLVGESADLGDSALFGAVMFLVFVFANAQEVMMFQNSLVIAIPAWAGIGIGLSRRDS